MLNRIVHFSLRFRGVVVALACVLVGYGIYVASNAKLDVFPNFVPPEVTVETEAPGLSPEQVEILVTRPLESTINGLGGMDSLRSESIAGLSTITAIFKEGTDIFIARQMLQERIGQTAGELPAGVKTPVMSALMSSTMDLLKIGLVSTNLTPMQLRTFADWTVKPRLLSVPGVAHCIVFGGDVRQLQIQVHPDQLMAYGLSISDVLTAAGNSTAVMGAGFVENANQRILIQTEGQALTPEVLGEVEVSHVNGRTIRLKDVASVEEGAAPKFGDALIQGQPGVFMALASQYGANTMEATLAVEAALNDMKPLFDREGITLYARLHRPATFIENSLRNITHSLYMGGILVAVVLLLFLGHLRAAFISITAIPLSLLTAIVLLDKFGVTLNTITLGGLAIAIGAVVDDAIIDVENIFRRLRENEALAKPRPVFQVVLDASLEVRSAVVYATFIVALVFLPVLAMTGIQGSFFAPLALSYILAIMASLAVALTITPALALLSFKRGGRDADETRLQKSLKSRYTNILEFVSRRPRALMVTVGLICMVALLVLPQPGEDLLPEFREGHFVLQVQAIPGTSLPEMVRIGHEISRQLLEMTNIATVEQQAGRAEQGEDTWEPNRCEFHVELVPDVPGKVQAKMMEDIRGILGRFPGIQSEVVTFLGDRISETISGETAPVVISVYGDDLDVIDDKAREIAQLLNNTNLIQGVTDVEVKAPPGMPRLAVRLRPERLTQFGFRPVEVLEAVQTAYAGAVVAQVHDANRTTDVAVMLDPDSRREPEQVGSLLVKNADGLALPLKQLADVYMTTGRSSILHDGASRRQVVTCAPEGRDVGSLVADAKKQIAANVKFPRGVYAVFTGAAEQAAAAQRELLLNSAVAGVGILILLIIVTGNWRNLLLILANVPFALVGGVLAVLVTSWFGAGGESLTIGSLVGFVTLFGITTRNSIMMISHFEHLVRHEGMDWGHDAAMRGASERVIPILMTALVTAIGLLPLALGTGEAGREIEGPMAIVILGGLITSTALNLLVLPTLALRYGRFERLAEREE
ncbi:MAG TPA: efflux RND transporter permease subunit [Verrucomicrobiae bacterium]|jgi:CzcA family heavy metal efflux pump|nr:efflux RND transporter permease subunit [Verrucomicrobiae bacterium]